MPTSEVCPFYNKELKKTPCPNPTTHIVSWWDGVIWHICDQHAEQCRKEKEETVNYIDGVWSVEELLRRITWKS